MENKNVIDTIKEILGLSTEISTVETTTVETELAVETTVETELATEPIPVVEVPSIEEVSSKTDELESKVEDLNTRLTLIESMFMESQKKNEKLEAVIEVLKNTPSGDPVINTEVRETTEKQKLNKNEQKFYNLGKTLGNSK